MDEKLAIHGGRPIRDPSHLFPQWPEHGVPEIERVQAVVSSGVWGAVGGPQVVELSERFAAMHEVAFALPVSSGTAALWLCLKALEIGPGDEVIVPAYTFIATASVVCEIGAIPVFVDIEGNGLGLDPLEVAYALTDRTRAVIPVHMAGIPANVAAIKRIAEDRGIPVIEDAAQAHGASLNGHPVGSIGDMGAFSFQSSKNLTAGEGGMITTNDPMRYERLWSLHNCGRLPAQPWYEHYHLGENWRMTELQAALLLAQMERWRDQHERRQHNAEYLRRRLAEIPGVGVLDIPTSVTASAWHLLPFRVEISPSHRDLARVAQALQAEGLPITVGYPVPLYRQPVFKHYPWEIKTRLGSGQLPRSERACEQLLWIPQYVLLAGREDMDDLVRGVVKVLEYFSRAWTAQT